MSAESNLELLLPQIAWHDNRGAIQSVDASSTSGLIATAGNDNEVHLWRASQRGIVSFVQALTGHTKVRRRAIGASGRGQGEQHSFGGRHQRWTARFAG